MNTEASVRRIAIIALSETTWTWFIRSGHLGLIEDCLLDRAQKDLEQKLSPKKGLPASQERRLRGAERIRGYLDGHRQPF